MSMQTASSQNIGPTSSDMETSAPLTGQPLHQLMLFAEGSPASHIHSLVDAAPQPTSAISGPNLCERFAVLNRDGSWRRMFQDCYQVNLDGSSDEYLETWPKAGISLNGTAYLQAPSMPLIDESESGLWPTPTAVSALSSAGRQGGVNLARAVMFPTPTFTMAKGSGLGAMRRRTGKSRLRDRLDYFTERGRIECGRLNPTWVEWVMGYPLGWTVCAASAMRSCRKSRNGSRAGSSLPRA